MNQPWTKYLPAFVREKIEGQHYLQNVISNTGWQFADNLLRMGVGLFVGIWVARYLGPGQYGLFSYALAFVALFSSIASLGLDEIATRNIVRDPAAKDEILGTTFVLKLIAGTVIFAVSIGVISVLRPADSLTHWLVGIIAAGTIFQAFSAICIKAYQLPAKRHQQRLVHRLAMRQATLFQVSRLGAHFGGNVVGMGDVEKGGDLSH